MNPLHYPIDWVDKLMRRPRHIGCVSCDEPDHDRETLFEYPKNSWQYWCACCFQNYYHKEWNSETNRWKKIRCECHDEIEVWDDHESMWLCPYSERED